MTALKRDEKKQNPSAQEERDTIVGDIIKTDFAMQSAMEEAGMEAKTYGIWGFFWRLFGLYARALQPQHGQLHRMHHYETGNKQYCQIQYSYRFHDCIIQRRRAYILPLLRE